MMKKHRLQLWKYSNHTRKNKKDWLAKKKERKYWKSRRKRKNSILSRSRKIITVMLKWLNKRKKMLKRRMNMQKNLKRRKKKKIKSNFRWKELRKKLLMMQCKNKREIKSDIFFLKKDDYGVVTMIMMIIQDYFCKGTMKSLKLMTMGLKRIATRKGKETTSLQKWKKKLICLKILL